MPPEPRNSDFRVPAKLYRIGELVRYTPFSRQTIHNYTIMGLIREAEWTDGGHRLYDESVFDRLSRIMQLKQTKTLTEIRRLLAAEKTERSGLAVHPAGSVDQSTGITQHGRGMCDPADAGPAIDTS